LDLAYQTVGRMGFALLHSASSKNIECNNYRIVVAWRYWDIRNYAVEEFAVIILRG